MVALQSATNLQISFFAIFNDLNYCQINNLMLGIGVGGGAGVLLRANTAISHERAVPI